MRIIGLTGGIACGKSTVSNTLRQLGACIIDGDVLSRQLTAPGGSALPAIRGVFGIGVFQADGTLDRRALADRIFPDPQARQQLDDIMQPMILELIRNAIDQARRDGCPICVLDMPLLFEKGLERLCDTVWCVTLPEDVQLARLIARDALSPEAAQARLSSQMPVTEKASRSNTVIDNTNSPDTLVQTVIGLYQKELREEEIHGKPTAAQKAQNGNVSP